ncbi:MAG: hypothetical protein KKA10_00645 [Euryarchaeota archaeon]|nr:hypothetical protein [Euryarchaeota archaeon]MCG2734891.1 hypothetical protein [Candidatus Methanoperedenaceae archaeon]
MDMNGLRIGYVPYSDKLDQPGDRRRFCYYANKRNIAFEIAKPSESYDLVVVTESGDLSVWSDYHKGNAKIIYDFIDSYLAIPRWDAKGLLRGLAKYVAGQSKYLRLDHWKTLQVMCRRADAVICSTEEQKQDILQFCQNVHIILDIHSTVMRVVKTDYSAGDVFNLVWEGLPHNIQSFYEIKDVLESLKRKYKIALHIVTDLEYGQYLGKYPKLHTANIASKLFDDVYLYEWNEQICSAIISACDMGLIPIPLDNPLASGKPENKLLLFWRMGMPTVVSATPAYSRAMHRCGLPMACRTQQEWQETLERYIVDESARRDAGQRGKAFAEYYYSEEKILAQWDNLIASVLY